MHILLLLSTIILFVALHASPLLGTLSAEAGLLVGAVLGPLTLIAGAARGGSRNDKGFGGDFAFTGLYAVGALFFFVIAAFFNSFRFESCSDDKGLNAFLIMAFPVVCLNLVSGIWLGRLVGKRDRAIVVAILFLISYLIFQIVWWWLNPNLQFFNHYLVVVAGDLIKGQGLEPAIIGYRLSTLLYALALTIFGLLIFKPTQRRYSVSSSIVPIGLYATASLISLAAVLIQMASSNAMALGRSHLNERYSLQKKRGTLVLHADPLAINADEADAILAEGTLWLERLKLRSGINSVQDIHIWLHQDTKTLNSYTGAKNVHFTLPRHREIHITRSTIPHPTLGHELAHVVIGEASTTLFGLPGVLGVLPNSGVSEGLAVLLTPELAINEDLTIKEQAAAIYQLGYLKDFESLFAINPWSFWLEPSVRSYIAAGAFLEELIAHKSTNESERHALIQRLAAAGELYPIWQDNKERDRFIERFSSTLKSLALPKDALYSASRIFKSPAIAYAECDNKHSNTGTRILAASLQHNYAESEKLLLQSKANKATQFDRLADIALHLDDRKQALYFLQKAVIAPDIRDERQRSELLEKKGDLLWADDRLAAAQKTYEQIDVAALPIGVQRQVIAKKIFIDALIYHNGDSESCRSGLNLLSSINNNSQALNARFADLAFALGSSHPILPTDSENLSRLMARYIFGRGQILGGSWDIGKSQLNAIANHPDLPELIRFEANRILAYAHAQQGEMQQAYNLYVGLENADARKAHQLYFHDLADRALKAAAALQAGPTGPLWGDRWLVGLKPKTK